MLANYLIGLREGLEAALVVGILVAYLVKTGRRDALGQLWLGVGLAVGVCVAFGAALTFGPRSLAPGVQEKITGTLSIAAVGLVTWMIFWMARTARHLKANLHHRLDDAVAAGRGAVLLIALLAVGREGLETAVFLWATAATAGSTAAPLLGAALGLVSAVALGWAIYRGALTLNLRAFFAWTGIFLIAVAAGVLAYGVHELQEAGVLPGLTHLAFDVSAPIPPTSWYGTLLKGVFSFSPATTWLALSAWLAYTSVTLTVFVRTVWFAGSPPAANSAGVAAAATAAGPGPAAGIARESASAAS
ncbi:MAG TPA: iron uptake transporter permease EfeU [Pengzhenrongella sp.]|jgi:high-affinity iron transporter